MLKSCRNFERSERSKVWKLGAFETVDFLILVIFLATRSMTRINVGLALSYVKLFSFLMENIYVQFDGMVYQQIVGIPMGTNTAPLIADLFLYCYERDFMSNLHKSKRHDLIDLFNDNSRYLDDIFTIDNP